MGWAIKPNWLEMLPTITGSSQLIGLICLWPNIRNKSYRSYVHLCSSVYEIGSAFTSVVCLVLARWRGGARGLFHPCNNANDCWAKCKHVRL